VLAVIGGSGLARLASLAVSERKAVRTPYGEPSAPLTFGTVRGRALLFLARHGDGHTIAPHQVNYRANIWALRQEGAEGVVSVAAVGGIRAEYAPGSLVVPDQIVDYTWGRPATFFESADAPVTHIDFTHPYSEGLRERILAAARRCGETVHAGGVYAATQGPRLETAAEIDRLERDGADLVGMTAMPEASLAREAGLEYAAIAVVANHAAGRGSSRRAVALEEAATVLERAMERVQRIIGELVVQ
jgi:5'-methylthioadenosine phosphorylase